MNTTPTPQTASAETIGPQCRERADRIDLVSTEGMSAFGENCLKEAQRLLREAADRIAQLQADLAAALVDANMWRREHHDEVERHSETRQKLDQYRWHLRNCWHRLVECGAQFEVYENIHTVNGSEQKAQINREYKELCDRQISIIGAFLSDAATKKESV